MNPRKSNLGSGSAVLQAINFSPWKRDAVKLCFPEHQIRFVQKAQAGEGAILRWGSGDGADLADYIMEDGFIRSVGLGADLTKPLSLVVDSVGIYYDCTRPSQLELLLQQSEFPDALLARADKLRQKIVAAQLSKYNLTGNAWLRPVTSQKVVLVVGQVETDASIRLGSPQCQRNDELLRQVRALCPDAFILYKPHPDVVAGLRRAGRADAGDCDIADAVVVDAPMPQLLTQVDAVHVMTSLTGFEAILRGVPVVCHGLPFYAGWGLTTDLIQTARRSRLLSVEQLVAASLILYPHYFDAKNTRRITVEEAVDEIIKLRQQAKPFRWWLWLKRQVLRAVVGVR